MERQRPPPAQLVRGVKNIFLFVMKHVSTTFEPEKKKKRFEKGKNKILKVTLNLRHPASARSNAYKTPYTLAGLRRLAALAAWLKPKP